MTDPYSPYQTPGMYPGYSHLAYGHPPVQASVPGIVRAAAVGMAVIGAGILLFSVLVAIVLASVPMEMLEETGAFNDLPPEVDAQTALTYGVVCMGVCGGAFGLVFLVFSPFVWRGSRGSTIVSAMLVGVTVLVVLLMAVLTLSQGAPQAAAGAAIYFMAAVVMGVLLFLLIRAVSALGQRQQATMANYQAWQYYQQQQAAAPQQFPPPGAPSQGPGQQSGPQPGSGWDQPPRQE